MWTMIPSLQPTVDCSSAGIHPTPPSSATARCCWPGSCPLGKRTLFRVAENGQPDELPDHTRRHRFDTTYNFFERSAWTPKDLAYRVCLLVFTKLKRFGPLTLVVDDTPDPQAGQERLGPGLVGRDAVLRRRNALPRPAATTGWSSPWPSASRSPRCPSWHCPGWRVCDLPGKGQPSCPDLAREMLLEVLAWFPNRRFVPLGDGAGGLQRDAPRFSQAGLSSSAECVATLPCTTRVLPRNRRANAGPKAKKGPRLARAARRPRERTRKLGRLAVAAGVGVHLWQDTGTSGGQLPGVVAARPGL